MDDTPMVNTVNFDRMGGRKSLELINKVFYDKIYQHPWIKHFFEHIPQAHIEAQQVDFMQKVLGGENLYVGKAPPVAHMHMYITLELFELRQSLLKEAFEEVNADPQLIKKWLLLDESFKKHLVKDSLSECKKRFTTDVILHFPKPE